MTRRIQRNGRRIQRKVDRMPSQGWLNDWEAAKDEREDAKLDTPKVLTAGQARKLHERFKKDWPEVAQLAAKTRCKHIITTTYRGVVRRCRNNALADGYCRQHGGSEEERK